MSSQPAAPPAPSTAGEAPDSLHPSASMAQLKIDPAKDLWTNIAANLKEAAQETPEYNWLLLGPRRGGKTQFMSRVTSGAITNVKEGKAGAAALEYYTARREITVHGASQKKDPSTEGSSQQQQQQQQTVQIHFWELGGGTDLAPLVDVVITPENITTIGVTIVADLSRPESVFDSTLSWLRRVHARVNACFERMRAKNSSTPEKMLAKLKTKYNLDSHSDVAAMRLCPVPIVVIATKADQLIQAENDSTKVELVLRALRYVSHTHSASFVCTSIQTLHDEREAHRLRHVVNHVVLGQDMPADYHTLELKVEPYYSVLGGDSFKAIHAAAELTAGSPKGFVSTGDRELDKWKLLLHDAFPPSDGGDGGDAGAERAAAARNEFMTMAYKQYAEPVVDACRRQKDELLEQWRRANAKKVAQAAAASGEQAGDKK
eukprot:PhM_4_TR7257/c0_g2_i1/m.95245/K10417/DYNC2LI; dynein light intermediate chain 2, cytosolic